MLLVSDIHGAAGPLRKVVTTAMEHGEALLVLGDLINFIDYRDLSGIVTDISGAGFVAEMVRRRTAGDWRGAGALWEEHRRGREDELRAAYAAAVATQYEEMCAALDGAEAYVTYGNVDQPQLLRATLPSTARFVDGEALEIEGVIVGIVGGGVVSIGTPGEVTEEEMEAKLEAIGGVEVLCTHVPPAVPALSRDVIGGRAKGSGAVLRYLERVQPRVHYFGDIHQPQATTWRVGATRCRNVGYFRATGRAVRHER